MLPWPPGWPARPRAVLMLSFVFLITVAIGMSCITVFQPYPEDRSLTIVISVLAVLLVVILIGTGPLLRVRRRWWPRLVTACTAGSGENGVCIPNSTWLYRWLITVVTVIGVSSGVLMWVVLRDGGPAREIWNLTLFLISVVALLYCGWFLIDVARGQIARGQVVLSPRGIYHRSVVQDEFVPWTAVLSVNAEYEQGPVIVLHVISGAPKRRMTTRLAFRRGPSPRPITIRGNTLAVDSALLFHALAYYHSRPEARAELTTDLGVQRIRTGDLLAP